MSLTASENVLASCTIAREKLEIGDYDAGCASLQTWWRLGPWPCQKGLSNLATAELLLVAGTSVVGSPVPNTSLAEEDLQSAS